MNMFGRDENLLSQNENPLPPEEEAVLDKVAHKVVDRGMTVPAILALESVKPLNYIGSQLMVFFEPIVQSLFNFKDYDNFRSALEKRVTIEILLLKIEKYDAIAAAREKRIKKYYRELKKSWKWYQRYFGVFRPRVKIPEEVLNPPPEPDPEEKKGGPEKSD
jgi:hypothetical protein